MNLKSMVKKLDLLDVWFMLKSALIAIFLTVVVPLGTSYFLGHGALVDSRVISQIIWVPALLTVIIYKHEKKKHKDM